MAAPQVFRADDLDGVVTAFLANSRSRILMESGGRTLEVGAIIRADDFASRALASLNSSEQSRRMAVRTAILLARPESR